MNNKLSNLDVLSQDFPEVEVEKNAKATFIESFEDYLEEEYLDEASIWDKVKGKASELKDKAADFKDRVADAAEQKLGDLEQAGKDIKKKVQKAVTGKIKLTPDQEHWIQAIQKSGTTGEGTSAWLRKFDDSKEVKELSDKLSAHCSGYCLVYCNQPAADKPAEAVYMSKSYPTFSAAVQAAKDAIFNPSVQKIHSEYIQTYNYVSFPILICADLTRATDMDSKIALQACPSPGSFGFYGTTGRVRVLAVDTISPSDGIHYSLYVSNVAYKVDEFKQKDSAEIAKAAQA